MGETKYLSDVISYKKDIAQNFLIEIWAGVGSGKNTFIEEFIKGEKPDIPQMNVLLITSRRKKVDETYYNLNFLADDNEKLKKWIPRDISDAKNYKTSVVCTNAAIGLYLKNDYRPDDKTTHLWELFDLIVVDEAHSMVTDATYQTAPFYVYDLIQRIIKEKQKNPETRCKHIILMTGTIEPIRQVQFPVKPKKLYVFQECRHIEPRKIHFIYKEKIVKSITTRLSNGEKILYFANHTGRTVELAEKLNEKYWQKIAVSFTNPDTRKKLKKDHPDLYDRMTRTEDKIEKEALIPDDISLFVTTSRYKEGINIKNKDFTELYVEAHNQCDIKQMVGRLRADDFVRDLYIVVDAAECAEYGKIDEIKKGYAYYEVIGHQEGKDAPVNDYMLKELDGKVSKEYIDFIESRFDYVRYSYLDRCFKYYLLKEYGVKFYSKSMSEFRRYKKSKQLKQLVQKWFPNAQVDDFGSYESSDERAYKEAWNYWNREGIQLDTWYTKTQLDIWRRHLLKIFKLGEGTQWGTLLRRKFPKYEYTKGKSHNVQRGKFIEKT